MENGATQHGVDWCGESRVPNGIEDIKGIQQIANEAPEIPNRGGLDHRFGDRPFPFVRLGKCQRSICD